MLTSDQINAIKQDLTSKHITFSKDTSGNIVASYVDYRNTGSTSMVDSNSLDFLLTTLNELSDTIRNLTIDKVH